MSKATTKGFTIIELLVVIAIIGLISSVVLVSMKGNTGKAKRAKGLEFSQTILNTAGYDAVGVWRLEGDTTDKSGYGNNGTIAGSSSWISDTEECINGKCIALADGYISMPGLTNRFTGMTIEGWFKKTNSSWDSIAFMGKRNSSTGWMLYRNSGDTAGYFRWYTHYVTGGGATVSYSAGGYPGISGMKTGIWHHIAVFRTADGITDLYRDGKLVDHRDAPSNFDRWRTNGNGVSVGSERAGSGSYDCENCQFDEVRIYERALGSSEIQQHYAAGAKKHQLAINNNQ